MLFTVTCVSVHLVDDVDRVLQQESRSLLLVDEAGVLSELLDLFFSCLTEQHLNATQTQHDTPHHILNNTCYAITMRENSSFSVLRGICSSVSDLLTVP